MKTQLAAYGLRAVHQVERIRWPHIEVRDVVMILLVGACLLYNAHSVQASERTWCSTLNLLTSHPVPKPADPAANPSREQAYRFYLTFLGQRHRLGCG